MKTIVYDEAYHAEALIEILEMKDTCGMCPRDDGHNKETLNFIWYKRRIGVDYYKFKFLCCDVCRNFVGIEAWRGSCPCYALGVAEAKKQSWIALEEKGYI